MMHSINVTHLVSNSDTLTQYSDSVYNSGLQNTGEVTWRNARRAATDEPLVGPEHQETLRNWLYGLGGWTSDEIDAMTDTETNALLLQFIAGDIQEMQRHDDPTDYAAAQQDGQASPYLWCDDEGKWFFDICS